jgi:ABC-type multidrug transport system fused ATPase/permease subunit
MSAKLSASFQKRVARGDRHPLFWAMYDTFRTEFWIGGLCQLSSTILQVMTPYTLRYLIAFATEAYVAQRSPTKRSGPPIGRGLGLAFAVAIMQSLQSLGTTHFIYRGMMVGAQSRAVLISAIFEKAMTISGRAKAGGRALEYAPDDKNAAQHGKGGGKGGPKVMPDKGPGISGDGSGWANGKVVNLMSTDTYRIDQASGMFHVIWTAPVAMVITLVVLLINLTYSALAGFSLLVLGTPLFTWAIKVLFRRRAAINKVTDQRVGLTQEILQAVRFVKYFGWESSFLERLGAIRRREIRAIQVLLALRNAVNAVSMVYSQPCYRFGMLRKRERLTRHAVSSYFRVHAGVYHVRVDFARSHTSANLLFARVVQCATVAFEPPSISYWPGY